MAPRIQTPAGSEQELTVDQKIQKLRELYADAPEVGRVALENGLADLQRELAAPGGTQTAGRIGARQGRVSELTTILKFAPGGAQRLHDLLDCRPFAEVRIHFELDRAAGETPQLVAGPDLRRRRLAGIARRRRIAADQSPRVRNGRRIGDRRPGGHALEPRSPRKILGWQPTLRSGVGTGRPEARR